MHIEPLRSWLLIVELVIFNLLFASFLPCLFPSLIGTAAVLLYVHLCIFSLFLDLRANFFFQGFERLDDWPKILLELRKLMAQSGPSEPSDVVYPGSKHLALLRMSSNNGQRMAYVNMVDNFLQAALHLFYLKMTEFPDGALPDYPDLLNDHLRCVRQMYIDFQYLFFPASSKMKLLQMSTLKIKRRGITIYERCIKLISILPHHKPYTN